MKTLLEKTYTLEQIKAAFWEEFNGAGELWFPYTGSFSSLSEEEVSAATNSYWESFLEKLKDQPN